MKYQKNKIPFQIAVVVISLLFTSDIYAQTDDSSDLAAWSSIGIGYKLNKKWSFGLEEQLRLKNNISEIDEYFTQLDGEYKVIKDFRLSAGLRYIRENDNQGNIQGYENHFRFNIDATYKHELNDFSFGYRLRYQNKNEIGISPNEGDYANQNIRLKTSIEYNIKKWPLDPKLSGEIYNRFEKNGKNNGFSKYRITVGTYFKLKKLGKIKLFYRIQKELNVELPETENILGLKYTYTIKNK